MESAGVGTAGDRSGHALFCLPVGDGTGRTDQKDDGGGYDQQGVKLNMSLE